MRGAGPALVDQHDVPITADAFEHRRDAGIEGARCEPRAAGQEEQRIGSRVLTDGGNARHEQLDLSAARILWILRDGEPTTLRVDRDQLGRMGETAGTEL